MSITRQVAQSTLTGVILAKPVARCLGGFAAAKELAAIPIWRADTAVNNCQ